MNLKNGQRTMHISGYDIAVLKKGYKYIKGGAIVKTESTIKKEKEKENATKKAKGTGRKTLRKHRKHRKHR